MSDTIAHYRLVVLTYLAASIAFVTYQISGSVGVGFPASQAIAAGYIFMAIVQFVWVFVFGSAEESYISTRILGQAGGGFGNKHDMSYNSNNNPFPPNNGHYTPNYGGFANQNHTFPPPGMESPAPYPPQSVPMNDHSKVLAEDDALPKDAGSPNVVPNAQYLFKAKALYAYEANPEDPKELSFAKGELLEIMDNKGKWWQARKANGEFGIAPSNYLELV
ncbi:hypothetical protein BZG36_00806 [Bifiguratus adelaidae]|uniref:SH3 domain-containing protein n=1 Tax=Bifiguratus adelaidae TaxID=1938954 RepID=A0A261Y6F1_9FUNG|nr:hypothetical protein BZG36_00806 [Bifiguratus adelaidae]